MVEYIELVLSILIGIIGILTLIGLIELQPIPIGFFLLALSLQHFKNYLEE